jgi:hypothetical protein
MVFIEVGRSGYARRGAIGLPLLIIVAMHDGDIEVSITANHRRQ